MRAIFYPFFLGALFVAATARAEGNADLGRTIAQNRCASCHVVEPNLKGGDTAPPFTQIARKRGNDTAWLRAWLTNPHPPMQGIALSNEEIDDIIAYLQTLPKQ